MAPITNGRHIYMEIPEGYPVPGKTMIYDTSQKIDLETVPLNGGFLLKTLILSLDPFLRGRMRDPLEPSYVPAFVVGEPIAGFGISVVLRSEHSDISVGDHLYTHNTSFQEYVITNEAEHFLKIDNKEKLPWSMYLGVLGMPGQTAVFGWKEYSAAQKGDVVFVTAAAGPVGSLVVQLAKLEGLKVIASAGSDSKVEFLKEIGADVAFNYKNTSTHEVLKKEGPINVYWDNVGGETLDIAMDSAATGARFIECGMISTYNNGPYFTKNLMNIIIRELKLFGFVVTTLAPKYSEKFYKEMPAKVARGEIKYREDITHGLEKADEVLLAVFTGKSNGKSILVVADEI